MSDLISRQAAIDLWEKYHHTIAVDAMQYDAELRRLPSAQLGTNLAEVGTDAISRQQAIDDIWTVSPLARLDRKWVDRWLRQLPSAQPEIIQCKDCKYWMPYEWMFSEVWRSKNIADYPEDEIGCACCDMAMKANNFCSRAERREVRT